MANQHAVITTRLLLEYQGQVLFLKQTSKNGGGFTLPGGRVEVFEYAKQALVRETREETGIKIKKNDLQLVHIIHHQMKQTSELVLFFKAEQWFGELKIKEPEKFKKTVWIPYTELPEKMPLILQFAFKQMQQQLVYSEYPGSVKAKLPVVIGPPKNTGTT